MKNWTYPTFQEMKVSVTPEDWKISFNPVVQIAINILGPFNI